MTTMADALTMRLRQDGLTWHRAGDDVVVLDLQGSAYFRTNGSGTVLWELLDQPRTEAELCEELMARYGIDRDRAAADVGEFLADLRSRDMIEG